MVRPRRRPIRSNLKQTEKGFFRDVGDDIFLRVDEKGNILGFAILNATKRTKEVREAYS